MDQENRNALPKGFEFEGYRIERELGAGGFGITYLAVEIETGRRVAIKEYLPKGLAMRAPGDAAVRPIGRTEAEGFEWGLARFADEARTLVRLRHPHIVLTFRFFRGHGTAYLVMDFVEGESLGAVVQRVGKLGEAEIRDFLMPLIDGLKTVHEAGFLHRDIKPDNIFIRADTGAPVLLDFGAARAALGRSQHSLTTIFSAGYAPYEQYGETGGDQGPWTDIYALAATAYRCLAGARPVPAPDRVRAVFAGKPDPLPPAAQVGARAYAPEFLAAIDAGLRIKEADRPQNMLAFELSLRAHGAAAVDRDGTLVAGKSPLRRGETPVAVAPGTSRWRWAAGVLLLVGAGFGVAAAAGLFKPQEPDPAPAPAKTEIRGPQDGPVFRDCPECPEMVTIPAGNFLMGSPASEEGRHDDEGPQRRVTIAAPFALAKYEVMRGEYAAFARDTGRGSSGQCIVHDAATKVTVRSMTADWRNPGFAQTDRHPVVCVTWADATAFVRWLSAKTGKRYRLPSEAELEYAARAGTTTRFPWGDAQEESCQHANGADASARRTTGAEWSFANCNDGHAHTAPVGSYRANRFGLHDTSGNVWEWTADCWNSTYAAAPTDGRAWLTGVCGNRVARGGSYYRDPEFLRSAARERADAEVASAMIGLRVAMSFEEARGGQDDQGGKRRDEEAKRDAEEAKRREPEARRPQPGVAFRDCPECPEMVTVPSGSFVMGAPDSEEGRDVDEHPQRRVTIAAPFAMGKYEVTIAEWDACATALGCAHRPDDRGWGRGRQPVMNVSWDDAQQYVAWLSRKAGKTYRLPSEAEWEYAARAGTTTPFSTGMTISTEQANFHGSGTHGPDSKGAGRQRPVAVGTYAANAFGLHDMHGNVWEWAQDCWNKNYIGAPTDGRAWLTGVCGRRVARGGSWVNHYWNIRSASRKSDETGYRDGNIGFRVVRTF